ncbi:MAG: glycosyltransferase, partial [Ignavibacteriales bacterium]|nr:glycosyltransferase [Ignavibacteriales bacterium]
RDEEAEQILNSIRTMHQNDSAVINLRGVIANLRGNKQQAELLLKEAIQSDPSNGLPCTNLGAFYWNSGFQSAALEYLEKGFMLAPLNIDALDMYCTVASALSEVVRVESLLRDAISLYPLARQLQFRLIDLLVQQKRNDEALAAIKKALATFESENGFVDAALAVLEKRSAKPMLSQKKWNTTLSICMIVKNEQANIARCLFSAIPYCDEIIIVDTGSSDRTKDIARLYGVKIFDMKWESDFSAARNCSFDHATSDMIFVLDADEIIAASDWEQLRRQIDDEKKNSPAAFTITTRNYVETSAMIGWNANDGFYPEERGIGWFPSTKVRAFPADSRIRMEGAVHEIVSEALDRAGIRILHGSIQVHHYGKLDAGKILQKQMAYYELGKKKIQETGENLQSLKELAIQADELKKYDEALGLWKKVLAIDPRMAFAHYMMGSAYIGIGSFEEARKSSLEALTLSPSMKDARFNYSLCLSIGGNREEARKSLFVILQSDQEFAPARALSAVLDLMEEKAGEGCEVLAKLQRSGFQTVPFVSGFLHLLEQSGQKSDYEALLGQCLQRGILSK